MKDGDISSMDNGVLRDMKTQEKKWYFKGWIISLDIILSIVLKRNEKEEQDIEESLRKREIQVKIIPSSNSEEGNLKDNFILVKNM